MLELKVRRIGSSLGVILPKGALDAAGLKEGDQVVLPKISGLAPRELYAVWKAKPVRLEFEED